MVLTLSFVIYYLMWKVYPRVSCFTFPFPSFSILMPLFFPACVPLVYHSLCMLTGVFPSLFVDSSVFIPRLCASVFLICSLVLFSHCCFVLGLLPARLWVSCIRVHVCKMLTKSEDLHDLTWTEIWGMLSCCRAVHPRHRGGFTRSATVFAWCTLNGIPMNARTQGFPAEHAS